MKHRKMRIAWSVAVVLVAAVAGWGLYTRHWIQQRHEMLDWAWTNGEGRAKAVHGIAMGQPGRLPWQLRLWCESEALQAIEINLDDLPTKDVWRVDRLKALFPEAQITIIRHGRRDEPGDRFS